MTAKGRSRSDVLFPIVLLAGSRIPYVKTHPARLVMCPQHALGKGGHRSEHLGNSGICVSLLLSIQGLTQLALRLLAPACQHSVPFIEEHRWSPSLRPGESFRKQAKLKTASFLVHVDILPDVLCAFAQQGLKNPHVYLLTSPA